MKTSRIGLWLALLLGLFGTGGAQAQTKYRILWVYTDSVEINMGSARRVTDSLIDQLNTVYSNSNLNIVAETGGIFVLGRPTAPPPYGYLGSRPLNYLAAHSWVGRLRNAYSADAVAELDYTGLKNPANYPDTCGRALTNTATDSGAFIMANMTPRCANALPVPDLMGKLMAYHSSLSGWPNAGTIYTARGYCSPENWRALPTESGCNKPAELLYSNTALYWGSTPVLAGDGSSDMAYAISTRIGDFAAFRVTPDSVTVPASLPYWSSLPRSGSAIQKNEFADAVAYDSIILAKKFTIDSGGVAQFRSNGTIRLDSGLTIQAGSSVTFIVDAGADLSKVAARDEKRHEARAAQSLPSALLRATAQSGLLNLHYQLETGGTLRAEVLALDGKRLTQARWSGSAGRGAYSLKLPANTRGMVLLRWTSGNKTAVRKVLIP